MTEWSGICGGGAGGKRREGLEAALNACYDIFPSSHTAGFRDKGEVRIVIDSTEGERGLGWVGDGFCVVFFLVADWEEASYQAAIGGEGAGVYGLDAYVWRERRRRGLDCD